MWIALVVYTPVDRQVVDSVCVEVTCQQDGWAFLQGHPQLEHATFAGVINVPPGFTFETAIALDARYVSLELLDPEKSGLGSSTQLSRILCEGVSPAPMNKKRCMAESQKVLESKKTQ